MSMIFRDSDTPPPKLSLTTFPKHKPPPEPLVTPPFQPMVSVPFQWEEAPGRPKPTGSSGLFKPKSVRCLKLPPIISTQGNVKVPSCYMSSSPTTVLDGPFMGRSMSHGLCFEARGPNNVVVTGDLGLDQGESGNDQKACFESCQCGSKRGPKGVPKVGKMGNLGFLPWDGGFCDVDVQVRITRFRRSRGSLYELTRKSSLLLEGIYESLKHMVIRKSAKKRR